MPENKTVRHLDSTKNNMYNGTSDAAREFAYNFCGDPGWLQDKDVCGSSTDAGGDLLDWPAYQKLFYDSCFEKTSCDFKLNNEAVKDGTDTPRKGCGKGDNQIYIQYACQMTAEETQSH